jgi:transcriptional regulator with XRE-family HTH domain
MAASVKIANGIATTNRLDALRLRLVAGETAKRVGERIRDRRLELGLNQRQLAERIPNDAVNNQRVSDWERGVHQPSERHLKQLATALEVDVAYFYAAPEVDIATPPLLNVLEGGEAKADEILSMLKQLVERQDVIEAKIDKLLRGSV